MVGQTVSHYRILKQLGGGGMGLVYQAEDERLRRFVALKFLPEELAEDPVALTRFRNEAQAASALNHPNICTIYDIDDYQGRPFIVMEFLRGSDLKSLVQSGPLPADKVVGLARQVAEALAAAHSKGIIHRDVKPANVFITEEGPIKLLDFGLAKLLGRNRGFDSSQGTFKEPLTQPGKAVGTPSYLSPEQLLEKQLDERSDIFSLGVVMYQMATGLLPFQGNSYASLFEEILHKEPPSPVQLRPDLSPELDLIIKRTLEKNRGRRYQSAKELVLDLQRLEQGSDPGTPVGLSGKRRLRILAALVLGLIAIPGALIGISYLTEESRPLPDSIRLAAITSFPGRESFADFSPDGERIAFSWNSSRGGRDFDIYVKPVSEISALRLTRHPGLNLSPTWSPDGGRIAFARYSESENGIFAVPVSGGHERKLAELKSGHLPWDRAIDWSPDGRFLAYEDANSPGEPFSIYLIALENLEKRRLTTPEPGSFGDHAPRFSPDGRTVAFVRSQQFLIDDYYTVPVSGGQPKRLTHDGRPRCSPPAWTADGEEIVLSSNRGGPYALWRVSVSGGEPGLVAGVGAGARLPAVSLQGDRLAYSSHSIDTDFWTIRFSESEPAISLSKLADSTRQDSAPQISPDGEALVFASNRSGRLQIWVHDVESRDPIQLTSMTGSSAGTPRWSPDGRLIAFDSRPEGHADIFVIDRSGGVPRQLTKSTSDDLVPSWSRDGRFVYFTSNRNQGRQIWKIPAEGGEAIQITRNGGFEAFESPDSRFLYYAPYYGEEGLWRTPVEGGDEVQVLDHVRWGKWAVTERGIYVFNVDTDPPTLELFDFASESLKKVAEVDTDLTYYPAHSMITASSDGKWVVFAGGHEDADIMLVESFR